MSDTPTDTALQRLHGLLGRFPDAMVAEAAGVSRQRVAAYRAAHQIEAYQDRMRRDFESALRKHRAWQED